MDLNITYHPGKKNPKADALSHYPVHRDPADDLSLGIVVAQVDGSPRQEGEQLGEDSPSVASSKGVQQTKLLDIIHYLENSILPEDDQSDRALILHWDQYTDVEGVLYHLASDKTLCVVVPDSDGMKLVQQSHSGKFGGHLGD